MDLTDLDRMSKLSPFELRNELVRRAARHSDRLMLNAGRANPNFLAALPRRAFFELGLFAISEAERSGASAEGVGGLPQAQGITARFERFVHTPANRLASGFCSLLSPMRTAGWVFQRRELLHEMVQGVLAAAIRNQYGCYLMPPRFFGISCKRK